MRRSTHNDFEAIALLEIARHLTPLYTDELLADLACKRQT